MMRVVIDSNAMETWELRAFLLHNASNRAVLADYVAMEAYKSPTIEVLFAQMSILQDFPKQVLVLKGTKEVAAVQANVAAISNRFIDRKQSGGFPAYLSAIKAAQDGNPCYQRQIAERRRWAQEHLETMLVSIGDLSDELAELKAAFSEADLRAFRAKKPIPDRMRGIIFRIVDSVAHGHARTHARKTKLPSSAIRFNYFIWRSSLCYIIRLMVLLGNDASRRKPEKARNDQIDVLLATYGTYFNGLMTNDEDAMLTHHLARVVLSGLGVRLAEDYFTTYMYEVGKAADAAGL